MKHSDFDKRESGTQTHHDKHNVMKVDKEVTCKTTDLKPPLKQRTFVSYLNSLITFFFGFFFLILHASKGINILCCWSSIFLLWFMSNMSESFTLGRIVREGYLKQKSRQVRTQKLNKKRYWVGEGG